MTTGAPAVPAASAERQHRAIRRGGFALASSSVLSSLAGVVYWWVAARAWSDAQVGQAAALISSMTLVAELASLGMTTGLVRHIPMAGGGARRLIVRAYGTAAGLAMLGGVGGVLMLSRWVDDLPHLDPALAAWFVAGTVAWVLFVLQDGALVGLGRATVVPVENALFGAGRVALVLVVAAAASRTTATLYQTWVVPSAVGVVAVSALMLRRYAPVDRERLRPGLFRSTVRFSIVNHVAAMLQRAWPMMMPVIVLSVVDAEASSHAFIAWSSAYALWLIASSTGQALLAECARTPTLLHRLTGTSLAQTLRLTVTGAVAVIVAAPWYLSIFGDGYVDGGTTLLRLLAVAAVPNAITAVYLAAQRARGDLRSVLAVQAGLGLPTLVLAVPALRWSGLVGLGAVWLANQVAVALVVVVRGRWDLWVPALTPGMIAAWGRLRHQPAKLQPVVPVPSSRNARSGQVGDDAADRIVTKEACGAAGRGRLRREVDHLRAIHDDPALHTLQPLVPEPGALECVGDRARVGLTAMPGVHADARDERQLQRIHDAATVLHHASSKWAVIGDDQLNRWVRSRLGVLSSAVRNVAPDRLDDLARLGDGLIAELDGAVVETGTIHGDLSPANVLVDPSSGEVTAIVDWELAGFDEPIAIDVVQLLLAFRVARGEGELGQLVAERFAFGWGTADLLVLDVSDERSCTLASSSRAVLLLAWLRHVEANITKEPGYAHHRVWIVRNVLPVVDVVGGFR